MSYFISGAILTDVITGADPLRDAIQSQLESQLANEFTLDEIVDLRPGSSLIEVADGNVTLSLIVQASTTLVEGDNPGDWTDTGETSEVVIPVDNEEVKFFRFGR